MFGTKNSTVLSILGVFTLLVVLAVQVLPHSLGFNIDTIEVVDFEESDTEKEDTQEEKKKYRAGELHVPIDLYSSILSSYNFKGGIPTPPYLEKLCPPPDLV